MTNLQLVLRNQSLDTSITITCYDCFFLFILWIILLSLHADTNWTVYSQSIQSRLELFFSQCFPCHCPSCVAKRWDFAVVSAAYATLKMTDESIQWQISDPLADFIIIISMLFCFVSLACSTEARLQWMATVRTPLVSGEWWISISSKLACIEKHDFEFKVLNKRNCNRSSVCIVFVIYLAAAVPAERFRSKATSINLLFAGKTREKSWTLKCC